MSSIIHAPVSLFQGGLKLVDEGLENVSLAAEAINRSYSSLPPVTSDFNENEHDTFVGKTIEAIRDQVKRGLPVTSTPVETISALLDAVGAQDKLTTGIDDRKMALEYVLVLLSRAPPGTFVDSLQAKAISLLYRDLPHPPSTNMGQKWSFRSSDGSGNSRYESDMGKSFTPYSRSSTSTHPLPQDELPDPELVFDMLIRRDKFIPHPAGLSGLFFNYATSVIHSVFRTSRTDWNINETSSYVDMGILYGNTQAHQNNMRIIDGRGKIIPDAFAEFRIANLPPGVGALLVCFNRNHNYLAETLLAINEKGTWKQDLSKLSADELKQQDHEIFNVARLINSLTYASVVLGDYLSAILGTNRDGSSWTLDIQGERRDSQHQLLERGAGNSCSVEFNVLYRLHPAMSEDDAAYTENLFSRLFDNSNFDDITPELFEFKTAGLTQGKKLSVDEYRKLSTAEKTALKDDSKPIDYLKVPFGRFKRDEKTQRLSDDDVAGALQRATTVPAASFKARGVPGVMRVIEQLGIQQARNWGACSLNEFRRFLGLKPYTTFEEWNPDPVIADAARKLYRTTENLELYVGLVAEESKPVTDGAGLCPSYTMARAILADAVALVRGDRYLTYDCTPFNLTAWGYTEGARNTGNFAWGGILGRVLNRALPRHFPATSVYTAFPLITPTGQPYSMDNILKKLGQADDYTFSLPIPEPVTKLEPKANTVKAALINDINAAALNTPYLTSIKEIGLTPSFLSVIDDAAQFSRVTSFVQNVFVPTESLAGTALWFHDRTRELVAQKNLSLLSGQKSAHAVDLVKDVFRLVPVHWGSTKVAGLPLKTSFEPHGIYYEQQLYQMLSEIYTYIYYEVDPTLKIPLKREAKENVTRLLRFIKLSLAEAQGGVASSVLGAVASLVLGDGRAHVSDILHRILALKSPIEETANDILAVISTASIELSQIFAHVTNFYLADYPPNILDEDYDTKQQAYKDQKELEDRIISLASTASADADLLLQGYVREALRLDPVTDGVYRKTKYAFNSGASTYSEGDKIWFDLRAAGRDASVFGQNGSHPLAIDPTRDPKSYEFLNGDGVFKVLGSDFVIRVTAEVVRAVFSLPGLRRAKGPAGTLRRFKAVIHSPPDFIEPAKDPKPAHIPTPAELAEYAASHPADQGEEPADPSTSLYQWKTAPGDRAWKWNYVNPEDGNRLTVWATGLTVYYDSVVPARPA